MPKRISPFLMLCIMGGLAIFSSTMSKNPALPLFIRSLDVPVSMVGFIAAASTVVGIIVSIPAGILSDIIGRRKVILIAAVIFATAPFFYLLITAPWQLVILRIYHGLATAILGPVAMAAVADTFQKGRGEKMAWYSSATMIGRFAAPFIGGLLIFGDDFRWVYLADGFAGILALLAAIRLPVSTGTSASAGEAFRQQRGKYREDIAFIFRHPGILATSGIEAVQYFAFGSLETFLPIYLEENLGYSTFEIGLLFTAQILVATLTKPVMGKLSDRYGRVPLITLGLLLGGITMGIMLLSGNFIVLAIVISLFGLGLATVTASTSALVADLSRVYSRGGALGVLSSIMDIGHSTGPMAAGILISAYSYQTAFILIGAGLTAASISYGLGMWRLSARMNSSR
jgi:DHA1 family multidrug resistance protein-like MFS transporter